MKFQGHYSGETNGQKFKGPIFPSGLTILVLDMEGVFDRQSARYGNGRRVADGYRRHNQAKSLVEQAIFSYRVDRVVAWSSSSRVLSKEGNFNREGLINYDGFPFNEVHQRIAGFEFIDFKGNLIKDSDTDGIIMKDLKVISPEYDSKVVAIEDRMESGGLFYPVERVVYVNPKDNLIHKLEEAISMFG